MHTTELTDFQKQQAVACFNKAWDYIDMEMRTADDELEMIHCAHASRFLWSQVGEMVHLARGEWQISKVYTLVDSGERALYHAQECLRMCKENNIGAFDVAFAHEAVAQAYKVLGEFLEVEVHKKLAFEALEEMEDKASQDYSYAKGELEKI